jgi:spore coat protein B
LKAKLSFLETLVNKQVIVYRGGPESKEGILRDVKNDYLVLETEDGLIFYQLKHLKSVLENSQGFMTETEEIVLPKEKTLYSLTKSYLNYRVQINRGGPECRKGLLRNVTRDFLTLETEEDGILYYQLDHIKSLSEVTDDVDDVEMMEEEGLLESPSGLTFLNDVTTVKVEPSEVDLKMIECDTFSELCQELKYSWVNINRGGPEKLEGMLVDVGEDYVTVVKDEEVMRLSNYHIRNINKIELEEKEEKEEGKDEDNKESNQEEDKVENSEAAEKDNEKAAQTKINTEEEILYEDMSEKLADEKEEISYQDMNAVIQKMSEQEEASNDMPTKKYMPKHEQKYESKYESKYGVKYEEHEDSEDFQDYQEYERYMNRRNKKRKHLDDSSGMTGIPSW